MSSAGRIIIVVAIMVTMLGCASKDTKKEAKYGHWIYRGSSTFEQIFQCVDKFEPHQNKDC